MNNNGDSEKSERHRVDVSQASWTPEKVAQFWDYWGERPDAASKYFSLHHGREIVDFAKTAKVLRSPVLDYGCGTGVLAERIAAKKVEVFGFDQSSASVAKANDRLNSNKYWKGAKVPLENNTAPFAGGTFSLITLIEVIEHLDVEIMASVLADIRRLLKKDGVVMITTPHDEDLQEASVYCPFCSTEFHPWQHMQRFTPATLTAILEDAGFNVLVCRAGNFARIRNLISGLPDYRSFTYAQSVIRASLIFRYAIDGITRPNLDQRSVVKGLLPNYGPHLIALATPSTAVGGRG